MASFSRGRFVVLLLVLCFLLLVYLQDVEARGSRRRPRSSRRRPRSSRIRARSKLRVRITRKPARRLLTHRIRKVARKPVRPPKPFPHRVTKTQLVKERRPFYQRFGGPALIGVVSYNAFDGPKYAGHYAANPHLKITIPKQRALVIAHDEFKVVNVDGRNCSARGNLTKADVRNVLNVTTTVSYAVMPNVSAPAIANQNYSGSKSTDVSIAPNALDKYIVTVETLTRFNQSVVDGSSRGENCTVILFKTRAYLVELSNEKVLGNDPNSAFPIAVDTTMILFGFAAAYLVELNL